MATVTSVLADIATLSASDKEIVNGKYFSIKNGILFSRNAANYFP